MQVQTKQQVLPTTRRVKSSCRVSSELQIVPSQHCHYIFEYFSCLKCEELIELDQFHLTPCCGRAFCSPCKGDGHACCSLASPTPASTSAPLFFRDILKRIEVYCPHNPKFRGGPLGLCDWAGPIASLKEHVETQCLYSLIRCPNNCSSLCFDENISEESRNSSKSSAATEVELFSLAELQEHIAVCPLEPTACPNACGHATMARKDVHEHAQMKCPLAHVLCPNECGYGACFRRQELPEHLQETCPNRKLKCPILACTQKVMACNFKKHVKEANAAHFESADWLNLDIFDLLWKDFDLLENLLAASICSKSFQVLRAIVRHSIVTDNIPIHFKRNENGRDVLGQAVFDGDAELVKVLLECDESKEVLLRPQLPQEQLLYYDAKLVKELNLLECDESKELLSRPQLPQEQLLYECLPLSQAIGMHHKEVAEFLFETMKLREIGGFTPLMLACFVGDVAEVQLLLGKNLTKHYLLAQDDIYHNTALMWACYFNHFDVLKVLLEEDCSEQHLLSRNADGLIALHLASMRGYSEVVMMLLKKNFMEEQLLAQAPIFYDANALVLAIGCNHTKLVAKLLLEAESSTRKLMVNSGQHTALMLPSHKLYLKAVHRFLNDRISEAIMREHREKTSNLDELRRSQVELNIGKMRILERKESIESIRRGIILLFVLIIAAIISCCLLVM